MSLADQIIEHGPYVGGQRMTSLLAGVVDLTQINELRDELIAARALKEPLTNGRWEIESIAVGRGDFRMILSCTRKHCGWCIEADEPADLAELVQRAAEHAEVCK